MLKRAGAYAYYLSAALRNFSPNAHTVSPRRLATRLLQAWSFAAGGERAPGLPTYMTVELTNHCNLDCVMCPRAKARRPLGFLAPELLARILDETAGSLEVLDLDLYGELLLHPRFDELISMARARGVRTSVSTNVTLLDETNSRRLIDSGLDFLVLSLDSDEPEVYEGIRRKGSHAGAMRNLERFLGLNGGRVFTVIQKVHMRPNKEELWDYVLGHARSGADLVRLKPYYDLDPEARALRVEDPGAGAPRCPFLWRLMVATWDGKVVPCCYDYDERHVLGDLGCQSVAEVWNGARYRELRRLHAQGRKAEVPLCKDCPSYELKPGAAFLGAFLDGLNARKALPVWESLGILGRAR